MKPILLMTLLLHIACGAGAQQVERIVFNLYTDSLKKGFYNYISVDGQFADGRWMPLDTSHLRFSANTGFFKGNDLFIDSTYGKDSVVVRAELRSNPRIYKDVIIYIRKRGFDEPLKTEEELINDPKPRRKQKSRWLLA